MVEKNVEVLEAEVVVVLSDESETMSEEKDEPDEVLDEQEDRVSKSVVLTLSGSSSGGCSWWSK